MEFTIMNKRSATLTHANESILATNKVLRNTYLLLSMTFIFSAFMAFLSFKMQAPPVNILIFMVGTYGLMFLTHALKNSPWGIVSVFAFTGFMGFSIGPILNAYIQAFSNGPQLIATAFGGTGLIFLALSGYALSTRKDFSYLGGFLFVAVMVAFLAMIAGIIFQLPAIQLLVSAVFILISSGLILLQTSAIIHGGERNYILATVSLFVSIYNLFISLLNILGAFSNRD